MKSRCSFFVLRLVLSALLVALLGSFADAAVYFVAANGSDGANGTSTSTPFLTIAHATSVATTSDMIELRAGDTFAENVIIPAGGAAGAPFTLTSYGAGQATIAPTSLDGISVTNLSWVTIANLTITGTDQAPKSAVSVNQDNMRYAGVFLATTTSTSTHYTNCTISNCTISHFVCGINGYCTVAIGSGGGCFDNLTISNCHIYQEQQNGIMLWSADGTSVTARYLNLLISGCKVHDCQGNAVQTGGIPIAAGFVSNGRITRNLIYNSGYNATNTGGGPGGVVLVYSSGTMIDHCEAFGISAGTVGTDGIGIDADSSCTECSILYCYAHGNDGAGIYLFDCGATNTVAFNVCAGNTTKSSGVVTGELAIAAPTGTQTIFGNTFVALSTNPSTSYSTVNAVGGTGTIKIYNNIICGFDGHVTVNTDTNAGVVEGNLYYSQGSTNSMGVHVGGTTYNTLAALRTAGFDVQAASIYADPLLGQACVPSIIHGNPAALEGFTRYRPRPGSPAIGAGLNLASLFSVTMPATDMAGATLPLSGYSIGAYNAAYTPTYPNAYDKAVMADAPLHYIRFDQSIVGSQQILAGLQPVSLVGATAANASPMPNDQTSGSVSFAGTTGSYGNLVIRPNGATKVAIEMVFYWPGFGVDGQTLFESNSVWTSTVGFLICQPNYASGQFLLALHGNVGAFKMANLPVPVLGWQHWYMVIDPTQSGPTEISAIVNGRASSLTWDSGGSGSAADDTNTIPTQTLCLFNRNNGGVAGAGAVAKLASIAIYSGTLPTSAEVVARDQMIQQAPLTFPGAFTAPPGPGFNIGGGVQIGR